MNYMNIDIKRQIHNAGLTQKAVAARMGVSPEHLSRILGEKQISIAQKKRIECAIAGNMDKSSQKAKNSSWISVNDGLPREGNDVIVAIDMREEGCWRLIARRDEDKWASGDDLWEDEYGCYVTHWMPLPEAPKEGFDDGTDA